MTPMLHPYPQPRLLTAWEIAAITAQCIRVHYPDDMTPVDPSRRGK